MDWRDFPIVGALNKFIPFTLIVWRQKTIDGGRASIFNGAIPFFTVLLTHLLTVDEKPNWYSGISVLLGTLGVAALIGPDAAGLSQTRNGDPAVVQEAYAGDDLYSRLRAASGEPNLSR